MSSPLSWGMGDAYAVLGASMCPWDMGGGDGAHYGPPVLSSMTSERIQRSEKGGEAGSDPRGHLWVIWGVYLWAGKLPLAYIILLKRLGGGQPPSFPWHARPQSHEIQDFLLNLGFSKEFCDPCLGHDTIWRPGQEMKVYVDNINM